MSNWIVTDDFTTPTVVTAASAQATYPVTHLLKPRRPFLTTRTADLTGEFWTFDFGSAKQLAFVVLNNANFATATWTAGSDGVTFGTSLGAFAVPSNPDVEDRRMGWQPIAMGSALRYLRLTPSSVQGGAAYFELGAALFLTAAQATELEYNVGLPGGIAAQGLDVVPFAGDQRETNVEGPVHKVLRMQQAFWRMGDGASTTHFEFVKRWAARGPTVPHLIYENRGQDGQGVSPFAYLTLLDGPVEWSEISGRHFTTTPLVARECLR